VKLFFDESGNSGADIYNAQQPVFAYAGVWLDQANEGHFRSFLQTLRARHRINGSGELKGRTLLKSVRGRRAIADVLGELHARAVPVSLIVVHKPYFSAGVLIEDCADSVYNPRFVEGAITDPQFIVPYTQLILDVADPNLLVAAWRARGGDDRGAFKQAYGALLASLAGHDELGPVARAMQQADLDDLWDVCERTRGQGRDYSPNLSAFNAMMLSCEQQAEQLGCDDVELRHDNQREFCASFADWFRTLREMTPLHIDYGNGNEARYPLVRLSKLAFVDSDAESGIQLADLLASAARIATHEATTGAASSVGELVAGLRTLCADRHRMEPFPFVIGPVRWQREMIMGVFGLAPSA
jgi:hypothetical protein